MSKHTPGPWSTYLNTVTDVVVRKMSDDGRELSVIARAKSVNAMKDARLIAAAPELLEACKTLVEWFRREESGAKGQPWDGRRDTPEGEALWEEWWNENLRLCDLAQTQALAAIAKAEGLS